jgi:hypothetical protein
MSLRPCAHCKFLVRSYDRKPCSSCNESGSEFVAVQKNGRPNVKIRVTANVIRERRRKAGLCPCCGKPPAKGRTLCQKHLDYMKAYHKKRYISRKRKAA